MLFYKMQKLYEDKGVKPDSPAMHMVFTGNGRYVRNLLEQAKMNQASRLLEYDFDAITAEEIKTIKAEDIVIPEVKTEVKRTIGFAC